MGNEQRQLALDLPEREPLTQAVAGVFAASVGPVSNDRLHAAVADRLGLPQRAMHLRRPIGRAGELHSPAKRAVRWAQQSLRMRGWLERVEGSRGTWQVTRQGRAHLRHLAHGQVLVAYRTDLGIAVWGNCRDAVDTLQDDITLLLTSPPYPLSKPRHYGNVSEREYVDWLCDVLAPFVARLRRGGTIALNLGNEVFLPKSPARSLYQERLTLALADRFGLAKLDSLIWHNRNKLPGPILYASIGRQQLNAAYEPILVFTNDPSHVIADNRRVLQPHTEAHRRCVERQAGMGRARSSGDGAHCFRPGKSFATLGEGRIARNVLEISGNCSVQRAVKAAAKSAGLPTHGASMPLEVARFLVKYLSEEGDMVADLFAGSNTTGDAAEQEGRRWWACEQVGEYVAQSAARFV